MEQFMAYLNRTEAELRQQSARLTAEERRDEGDMFKIRANVYGICKSVFQVLDQEKAKTKLTELHTTWENARTVAQEHNDVKKSVIEQIKMEALKEIEEKLEETFGV